LDITQTSIAPGTYCAAKKKIESCYAQLRIGCNLVGEYKDAGAKGVACDDACSSADVDPPAGGTQVAAVSGTVGDDVTCVPTVPTTTTYEAFGGYMPVSNVHEHSQINLDVAKFVDALKENPPNYELAKHIYENGGGHSCKSATQARTLQGFATKDLTGESYADAFYASGLAKDFWDTWFLAGLDGTGAWADLGKTQRSVSLQKGAMGLVTLYASHELEAGIAKASTEETRSDAKSGHAWDEGWAFYYGTDGTSAPWEVAKKRDADFPDGVGVSTGIVDYFNGGLPGVRSDTYSETLATTHMNVIYDMWTVTYMRAALKYLSITEKTYNAKAHAEGYAYWMAIAGWAASKCKTEADAMTLRWTLLRHRFLQERIVLPRKRSNHVTPNLESIANW
jgi:hypothetical protein